MSHSERITRTADPPSDPERWTTRKLLAWMNERFKAKAIDSPRVVAEMLLAHVLGCERMRLYMDADRPAATDELAKLRELVARASNHEPVQYLVGHAWFFSREYAVNRSTLIPRPSTETLVEHILQWLRVEPGHEAPVVADVGTGTGCIAISIAAQLASAHVIASDISAGALELAKRNASTHNVADRIEFILGHGMDAIASARPGVRFDAIVSNPPYIPDDQWHGGEVADNVKNFEPETALRGGVDGLDIIRPLISEAPAHLKPGGRLAIEIAHVHRETAMQLAMQTGLLQDVEVLKDHQGLWRVLVAHRV